MNIRLDKRQFLRGYLVEVLRDLVRRGVLRATDPIENIIKRVIAEFAQDVSRDIKAVVSELGREIGSQLVARGVDIAGNFMKKMADDLLKKK